MGETFWEAVRERIEKDGRYREHALEILEELRQSRSDKHGGEIHDFQFEMAKIILGEARPTLACKYPLMSDEELNWRLEEDQQKKEQKMMAFVLNTVMKLLAQELENERKAAEKEEPSGGVEAGKISSAAEGAGEEAGEVPEKKQKPDAQVKEALDKAQEKIRDLEKKLQYMQRSLPRRELLEETEKWKAKYENLYRQLKRRNIDMLTKIMLLAVERKRVLVKELQEACGGKSYTVRRYVHTLRNIGMLQKVGYGVFSPAKEYNNITADELEGEILKAMSEKGIFA